MAFEYRYRLKGTCVTGRSCDSKRAARLSIAEDEIPEAERHRFVIERREVSRWTKHATIKRNRKRKCPPRCGCLCHDTGGGVHDHHGEPCPGVP